MRIIRSMRPLCLRCSIRYGMILSYEKRLLLMHYSSGISSLFPFSLLSWSWSWSWTSWWVLYCRLSLTLFLSFDTAPGGGNPPSLNTYTYGTPGGCRRRCGYCCWCLIIIIIIISFSIHLGFIWGTVRGWQFSAHKPCFYCCCCNNNINN